MDADRLDALARTLATTGQRRTLLRLLTGIALGLTLWQRTEPAQVVAAKKCKKIKDKKKRKKCLKKAKETTAVTSPPPPPTPVPVLTYECPGPNESAGSGSANLRVAQAFVAAQSGSLSQIQFEVFKAGGSTGDFLVELLAAVNDVPTNTVLATATIPNAAVPDGTSILTATFSGPPVVAGSQYAAAVSQPGEENWQFGVRFGNDCAGRAFSQNPSGSGAFTELPTGQFDLITTVTVLA